MKPSQKAIDAACDAYMESSMGLECDIKAALIAAYAVDGVALVPTNILAELRKRNETIKKIGPRGEELAERVIANECSSAWPLVSALLAAASDGEERK